MLFSRLIAASLVALCCGHARGWASEFQRPNVILLMADDLGWGDTGFNGHPILQTPHLDEMARQGLQFERFYAAAPVCSPTRGSCLTGRHPFRYGITFANTGHLPKWEWTLAELLRLEGYRTGHFGKWHLGTLTKSVRDGNRGGQRGAEHYAPPWEHGFDTCFSTESKVPTWDPMVRPVRPIGTTWWNPLVDSADGATYGTAYWSNGIRARENLAGDDSQIIMDRALPFVRSAVARREPFLAVIWFHAPHLPVVAGRDDRNRYPGLSPYRQHYYGCITALDRQVGRLRASLRELEVERNTLVFFCSDNGPEGDASAPGSTGPLRGRKRSLFEGGVRVPGLAEWPGHIRPATKTAFPACTSDYLPTVLEIIGRKMPDDRPLDGVSLLAVLTGERTERAQPIAFESRGQLALIGNRYKILHRPERAGTRNAADEPLDFMLFDLLGDPAESTDLAARHPALVQQMASTLAQWRQSCRTSLQRLDGG